MILLSLMLVVAEPSAEALRLGREVAESGTLAGLLPVLGVKETEEMVARYPQLSPEEQKALRAAADRTLAAGRERILAATGRAYAARLSLDELRVLAIFSRTPAAKRLLEVTPAVIVDTTQAIGVVNFKGDVLAAFCKETGKLCDPNDQ